MYDSQLKSELTDFAHKYGKKNFRENYTHPEVKSKSALIFKEIHQNFHQKSWKTIQNNPDFLHRTKKVHSHFKDVTPVIYEMQSSNSSDALAMNIFCFPRFGSWNGVKSLLKLDVINRITFGFAARVFKYPDDYPEQDFTEIDVKFNDEILCECKLTEKDFTSKRKIEVEIYANFREIFHKHKLPQNDKEYLNYQLIRNILAANQHNCRFVLFCDMRRPDLAKSFFQTVSCIKDEFLELRTRCEIIYWQDISKTFGKELQLFLKEKYDIC
jgi:hypothetical protein